MKVNVDNEIKTLATNMLNCNAEEVRSLAWKTSSNVPGGRLENMVILAACEDPWQDIIYDIYPDALAEATAVRDAGETPLTVCSVSISLFMEYIKNWTVEIPSPESELGNDMIRVLVLHELGLAWAQILATPPKGQLS